MKKFIEYIFESYDESKKINAPLDETEDINLMINDDILNRSKLLAYNVGQSVTNDKGKDVPVNPKKFPTKAVDIVFKSGDKLIEIFLDTKCKRWDSRFFIDGIKCKLSPDQMGQFFNSNFYNRLSDVLKSQWPLTDIFYSQLYEGIMNKELLIDNNENLQEDDEQFEDKKITHTRSGRKIMNFNDAGVKISSSVFTCWPQQGKEFNWSQWRDYSKIKPLCRMRIAYSNDHEYTMSLNPVTELYNHRGFKIADVTQKPPVQWLTKEESDDFMKLSLVNKFVRFCTNRIGKYANMDPNEIFEKINNKDKLTIDDIVKTQLIIKKTLNEIIKNKQADDYKWSN